jgi:membrane protein
MSPPSPTDVLINTLKWIGVPALVLAPISIVFWLVDWFKTTKETIKNIQNIIGRLKKISIPEVIVYAVSQGAVFAIVCASCRLAHGMSITDVTESREFTWQRLWMNCTSYSIEDDVSRKVIQLTAGWLLVINFAFVARSSILKRIIKLTNAAIMFVSSAAGITIAIAGLAALSLALEGRPLYNIEMVSLYVFWVAFLWGGPIALAETMSAGESLFKMPHDD